ncbi:hypothetical protein K449DRAFT_465496 [Hypoxylon sp. EC38]|nr:hypothetical protein K449DRAFT_465496 [Hypoxylon sp. EC38]
MTTKSTSGGSGPAPLGYTPAHRVPTDSSYYSFDGTPWDNRDPNSQTWMYARDARQQQSGLPAGKARPYPSPFKNGERLPLSTPGSIPRNKPNPEWLHHPLIPGRTTTWDPQRDAKLGGVRSFYTEGNASQFDVGYHDPKLGKSARGHDKFSLANYHAAVPPPRTRTT